MLAGCVYNDEPMPQIVRYSGEITQPRVLTPPQTQTQIGEKIPRDWLPPAHLEKSWTAIVIHHSGTKNGSVSIFDRWHREGRHWDGIGYDFVIGNGTNSGDGQVEVTFRWQNQQTGAHCGGTPGNWANRDAIGICLVGDFNKSLPTQGQTQSLLKLVEFLQNRYKIQKSRIYGHNTTPGAKATDCPGRNFPLSKLKSSLAF